MAISKFTIMKFGGTSVEDSPAFERLVKIVRNVHTLKASCPVVVVSAMSGVTNALLASVGQATTGDPEGAIHSLEPQWERHLAVAQALTRESAAIRVLLQTAKQEISDLLRATAAETMPRPLLQDLIVSYGERLSAALLAAVLRQASLPAQHVDARRCIITNGEHGRAEPLQSETSRRTRAELDSLIVAEKIPVLGGFVGATVDGTTTTLGRGGSDYTAALLGAALAANEVQIWTDVTGVLTADPRLVSQARTITRLSYAEAAELAYFGAKVLHPKTIQPAMEQRIPVRICNAREPAAAGTIVCSDTELSPRTVKAIAHKTGITIVQVTSARMLGAYGFLHAIFEVFNRHRTAIDIVTTSEVSVSLSLDDTSKLTAIVNELKQLGAVRVEHNQAIICIVGEGLRATPGIAARIFNCLSDINVSLISHGASSVNVTFVVEEKNVRTAISRLHATFFEHNAAEIGEAAVA
ncbi:MAG: lysine-sensitive aspartokinase 3 [Pyrinomonadaceae bacterium]|nr:lysine-sensitive aspartokinase 3 [Pyrinomonadaceae bacterium]